jgi:hypothetical protein
MTRPAPTLRRCAALALACTLAACGGSSATTKSSSSGTTSSSPSSASSSSTASAAPTASSGGDLCSLLTDAEVSAVIGVPVVRREPNTSAAGDSCLLGAPRSTDPSGFAYVSFSVLHGAESMVTGAAGEPGAVSVPGVGSAAYYVPSAGTAFATDGDTQLMLQVVKAGVPGSQADVVGLLQKMAARR